MRRFSQLHLASAMTQKLTSQAQTAPDDADQETIREVDLSGRQLGDYRLLRQLGRGAMAEVYLAEQTSLSRQVAGGCLFDLCGAQTYKKNFHLADCFFPYKHSAARLVRSPPDISAKS